MILAEQIAREVSNRTGLIFSGKRTEIVSGMELLLRAEDLPAPNGFSIAIVLGWKSIEIKLIFDNYAGKLIKEMSKSDIEKRKLFDAVMRLSIEKSLRVVFRINEHTVNQIETLTDPDWRSLELRASCLGDIQAMPEEELTDWVIGKSCIFVTLVMALLPLKDVAANDYSLNQGLPEGACTKIIVNRYERNFANRSACIAAHGAVCKGCNFNFSKMYGNLGSGFIEVHHIKMVSQLGNEYFVDPVNDLIPLCSNCHSMVHRKDPPLTIEELKSIIGLPRFSGHTEGLEV